MKREFEIRIRVTENEKKLIKRFFKSGKPKYWKTQREMIEKLIQSWDNSHLTGKFIP